MSFCYSSDNESSSAEQSNNEYEEQHLAWRSDLVHKIYELISTSGGARLINHRHFSYRKWLVQNLWKVIKFIMFIVPSDRYISIHYSDASAIVTLDPVLFLSTQRISLEADYKSV